MVRGMLGNQVKSTNCVKKMCGNKKTFIGYRKLIARTQNLDYWATIHIEWSPGYASAGPSTTYCKTCKSNEEANLTVTFLRYNKFC